MRPDFQRLMKEATALTRGGRLQDATERIHAALRGDAPETVIPEDDVIDVEVREVADASQPRASARPAANETLSPEAFLHGRHGGVGIAGRDYRLYVPPGAGLEARPLVVMLHGCTQDADDFAAGTRMNDAARTQGVYVLYPTQAHEANPQRCWNWFKHSHQERERGEPALLAAMVRRLMASHAIDPARVYVAGLSAGGAMAAILGRTHPDLFAAVGVHSGLPAGAARDLPSALEAMKNGAPARTAAEEPLPTIVFHGTADRTVHPANGEQVVRPFTNEAATESSPRAPGRRPSTRRVWQDANGTIRAEHWSVQGAPHAWSGGSARGTYTDPAGPDATAEMLRFFLAHRKPGRG
ncbi:extracellular catalytic domain type 1 short-chain-length polyhydroxyalkanoate depolymerase [Ramlibacter sp. MMS24-I3-19]|uniref:extracellular catalytic domain type 1 short-chain-length polyhydroxyalkanoate depolymerase n=1 Tax=Ramlibacter sp. MMS24-I3-19 TaxID=3416606 RepID=UPI003D03AC6B